MKFEISPALLKHRGGRCLRSIHVRNQSSYGHIDGVKFMLGQIDRQFWLVPVSEADELLVDDIGPFDTIEQAYAQLRLRSE